MARLSTGTGPLSPGHHQLPANQCPLQGSQPLQAYLQTRRRWRWWWRGWRGGGWRTCWTWSTGWRCEHDVLRSSHWLRVLSTDDSEQCWSSGPPSPTLTTVRGAATDSTRQTQSQILRILSLVSSHQKLELILQFVRSSVSNHLWQHFQWNIFNILYLCTVDKYFCEHLYTKINDTKLRGMKGIVSDSMYILKTSFIEISTVESIRNWRNSNLVA